MSKIPNMLAAVALGLACSAAGAAPKDDLHAAFAKFLQAKSFRASVTDVKNGGVVSTMESSHRTATASSPRRVRRASSSATRCTST